VHRSGQAGKLRPRTILHGRAAFAAGLEIFCVSCLIAVFWSRWHARALWLQGVIQTRAGSAFPPGTLVVNLTGWTTV
jgi:hypothetical protein